MDLSQNTALEKLSYDNNNLTTLDVTKNLALVALQCYYNDLTTIDISQNTLLYRLNCLNNEITSLDVTNNVGLGILNCDGNNLTTLDVSQNTSLIHLICGFNLLTAIDVSNNSALKLFDCFNNKITSLDLSQNYRLTYIQCMLNNVTSLNVKNGVNTSIKTFLAMLNPDLSCIQVADVAYSTENWTNVDATSSFRTDCGLTSKQLSTNNVAGETTASFKMGPNPATDILTLKSGTTANYAIINKHGETLLKGNLNKGNNTINTSKLPSGLFFVKVSNKASVIVKKLIIE